MNKQASSKNREELKTKALKLIDLFIKYLPEDDAQERIEKILQALPKPFRVYYAEEITKAIEKAKKDKKYKENLAEELTDLAGAQEKKSFDEIIKSPRFKKRMVEDGPFRKKILNYITSLYTEKQISFQEYKKYMDVLGYSKTAGAQMNKQTIKKLAKLANDLDKRGLYKEANELDKIIKYALDKIAGKKRLIVKIPASAEPWGWDGTSSIKIPWDTVNKYDLYKYDKGWDFENNRPNAPLTFSVSYKKRKRLRSGWIEVDGDEGEESYHAIFSNPMSSSTMAQEIIEKKKQEEERARAAAEHAERARVVEKENKAYWDELLKENPTYYSDLEDEEMREYAMTMKGLSRKSSAQKLANLAKLADYLDIKGLYKEANEVTNMMDEPVEEGSSNGVEFINLTPHDIHINDIVVKKSGTIARVQTSEESSGNIGNVPVVIRRMGAPQGIPASKPGVIYIVSSMVLSALSGSGRKDVVAPDTGPTAIRNDNGQISSVTRLVLPE